MVNHAERSRLLYGSEIDFMAIRQRWVGYNFEDEDDDEDEDDLTASPYQSYPSRMQS